MTTVRSLVAARDASLGELLEAFDDARVALEEGRVFVDRRRVRSPDERVARGETVLVHAPRSISAPARVIAKSGGIVAALKPVGMPTIPDQRGVMSLQHVIARELDLPATVLHATSRLDVGVTGVVLFACTSDARERLAAARSRGDYRRRYVAIASGVPSPAIGCWDWPIGRARDPRRRQVAGRDAVMAETHYRVVAVGASPTGRSAGAGAALLAVTPITGRTHQIRVHAAHAGAPLVGDAIYGGPARIASSTGAVTAVERIALHAAWVEIVDAQGRCERFEAPVPDDLLALWRRLRDIDPAAADAECLGATG